MVGQKDTPSRLTFKSSLTLSLLLHVSLLALLVFGLPGDVDRAAGDNPSGAISVMIVTGVADRASAPLEPDFAEAGRSDRGLQSIGRPSEKASASRPSFAGPRSNVEDIAELDNPTPPTTWSDESGARKRSATAGQLDAGEGGVSTILQQIRNRIERNKYYPLMAKRSQIEGSPLMEFKIKSDGSLEYVVLKKSSGHKVLDESAAATLRQAAPYPFYPDPIALNIHYTLAR